MIALVMAVDVIHSCTDGSLSFRSDTRSTSQLNSSQRSTISHELSLHLLQIPYAYLESCQMTGKCYQVMVLAGEWKKLHHAVVFDDVLQDDVAYALSHLLLLLRPYEMKKKKA